MSAATQRQPRSIFASPDEFSPSTHVGVTGRKARVRIREIERTRGKRLPTWRAVYEPSTVVAVPAALKAAEAIGKRVGRTNELRMRNRDAREFVRGIGSVLREQRDRERARA